MLNKRFSYQYVITIIASGSCKSANVLILLERAMGFEPTIPTLARHGTKGRTGVLLGFFPAKRPEMSVNRTKTWSNYAPLRTILFNFDPMASAASRM